MKWELIGEHNRMNAIAAIAAARHAGVPAAAAIDALSRFENVKRRMEVRGAVHGITIYDDFAHHPTAIDTTVAGLRRKVGSARILAVLEPRSNTMKLGVDSEVAHPPRLLPLPQRREVRLPVHQVVDLHQLQLLRAQPRQRSLHLADAVLAPAGPHLGGEKEPLAHAQLRREVAHPRLGTAVHGRAVHHLPGQFDETGEHGLEGRRLRRGHVEAHVGAQPHRGDLLAGGGDAAPELFAGLTLDKALRKKLQDDGKATVKVDYDALVDAILAEDLVDRETGEVIPEANSQVSAELLAKAYELGERELKSAFPGWDLVGEILSKTIEKDALRSRLEAIMEIYPRLRASGDRSGG